MKYLIILLTSLLCLSCSNDQVTNPVLSPLSKAKIGINNNTTVTIDWTTFPDGSPIPDETVISDQFKSLGVVFLSPPGPPAVLSALGGILASGGPTGFFGDIDMSFVDVGYGLPTSLTVEIIGSGLNISARLEAFDSDGNSLGSMTHTYSGSTGILSPFTFDAPAGKRIASAIYNGGLNPNAAASIGTLIIQYAALSVGIDIKPGSTQNRINPKSRGIIPVAILTTSTFRAWTVDPLSVRFGNASVIKILKKGLVVDIDHDGDKDLVLLFKTQDTGIQCGDNSVPLTGKTYDGQAIEGSDLITTVGCK
jgi:hypothetical protein